MSSAPENQSYLAWDDDVLVVDPPTDWASRGVGAVHRSLRSPSLAYERRHLVLSPLTPRSPFVRMVVRAHRGIADETRVIPHIGPRYAVDLEVLWVLRARLLGEPEPATSRGWRRRVPRARTTVTGPFQGPYRAPAPTAAPRPPSGPWFRLWPAHPHEPRFGTRCIVDASRGRITSELLVVETPRGRFSVPLSMLSCAVRAYEGGATREQWTDLHFGASGVLRLGQGFVPKVLDEVFAPGGPAERMWSPSGAPFGRFDVRDAREG